MQRTVQTNFTSGMLDAKVRDHIDLQAYRNGAKKILNCRMLPQGGVTRRPGGTVVALLAEDDYQIEPFIFSTSQVYTFLFYDGAVDIWNKTTRVFLATVSGPWTAQQIEDNELRVEQQLDKMFVSHEDFETRVITRTGASTFAIATFSYETDTTGVIVYQPYHKFAAASVTLTMSATAVGAATATASAAYFVAGHVGLKLRYRKKQMTVTGYTSATQVSVQIDEALPAATAEYDWDEQAFSALRGWIRCLCLHLQRLWIGGGRDCPNVIWGSAISGPTNFNLGTGADDDAIRYPIYAKQVAEIISMVSNVHLQVFCAHGEFYVPKPDSNALTPGTFSIEPQSAYGSSNLAARQFDQTTIFITRKAEGMREFSYDALRASFAADALTFMSKSLLTGPRDLDVQMEGDNEEQESRAYVANDDGTIAVLSKVRKENIAGWSYWSTTGTYLRLGVIDSEVWAIVERTVNGVTSNYLEIFEAGAMLDFSQSLSGASATSWGPFNLHKGAVVSMISGDLYLGTATVDATTGMVTTPTAVTSIEVGYNFTPEVIPLQQQVMLPDGITLGEPRRYVSATAQVVETLSVQIKNRHLPNTLPDEDPSLAPDRFTGDFRAWMLGWAPRLDIVVSAPYPLPFTLNSLVTEVEV